MATVKKKTGNPPDPTREDTASASCDFEDRQKRYPADAMDPASVALHLLVREMEDREIPPDLKINSSSMLDTKCLVS